MGSYNPKIQNVEPSPAIFRIHQFRFPQNIQDTGQYEKLGEIKDVYIAIRQCVFKYFPIVFMAFIWVDTLEHQFEIWVGLLYCRLLSKVTSNTSILSEDGIVFPSTEIDIGGLPNLQPREMYFKFINFFRPFSYYQTTILHDERLFRVKMLMYRYSCFHSQGDYRLHSLSCSNGWLLGPFDRFHT